MKKIGKLKLTALSNADLEKREMNKLLGGTNCCICSCTTEYLSSLNAGNSGNASGVVHDQGGYGSGAYGS